jgi:hypothetical protein
MPIDAPGRLSEGEYWAVLAYILHEHRQLLEGTTMGRTNASTIQLAR